MYTAPADERTIERVQ